MGELQDLTQVASMEVAADVLSLSIQNELFKNIFFSCRDTAC